MARFDVYRAVGRRGSLMVDVQADLLSDLNTRVIVPLIRIEEAGDNATPRLRPVIQIDNRQYVLSPTDIAAIPTRYLGQPVANLETDHRDTITNALDFLFQGY